MQQLIEISSTKNKAIEEAKQKKVDLLAQQKTTNAWVSVKIREGKNREVRKIMAHLGYPVNRLIRTRYGPFTLENLLPGEIEPLSLETLGNLGLLPTKLSLKNQNEI